MSNPEPIIARLSNSSWGSRGTCRRKWLLGSYCKIRRLDGTSAMWKGTQIHDLLEAWYRLCAVMRPTPEAIPAIITFLAWGTAYFEQHTDPDGLAVGDALEKWARETSKAELADWQAVAFHLGVLAGLDYDEATGHVVVTGILEDAQLQGYTAADQCKDDDRLEITRSQVDDALALVFEVVTYNAGQTLGDLDAFEILDAESRVEVTIQTPTGRRSPNKEFTGRNDLVIKTTADLDLVDMKGKPYHLPAGTLALMEHKSTGDRNMLTTAQRYSLWPQATIYAEAIREQTGTRPVVIYNMVRQGVPKPPKLRNCPTTKAELTMTGGKVTKTNPVVKNCDLCGTMHPKGFTPRVVSTANLGTTTEELYRKALADNGQSPTHPIYAEALKKIAENPPYTLRVVKEVTDMDVAETMAQGYTEADRLAADLRWLRKYEAENGQIKGGAILYHEEIPPEVRAHFPASHYSCGSNGGCRMIHACTKGEDWQKLYQLRERNERTTMDLKGLKSAPALKINYADVRQNATVWDDDHLF